MSLWLVCTLELLLTEDRSIAVIANIPFMLHHLPGHIKSIVDAGGVLLCAHELCSLGFKIMKNPYLEKFGQCVAFYLIQTN